MFAMQTRALSHIELERSGNITSLSIAKAYRVNGVDISTEEKRVRVQGENPYILALFLLVSEIGAKKMQSAKCKMQN